MNAKKMLTVLVLSLLLALCMVLTACGSDPIEVGSNPGAHEHEEVPGTDGDTTDDKTVGEVVCFHLDTTKQTLKNKTSATCQTDGYTGDLVCDLCDAVIERGSVVPKDAKNHNYEKGDVVVAATCEYVGTRKIICKYCNDEQTESVAKLGHHWTSWETDVEATCTAKGLDRRVCDRENCDAFEERETNIKTNAHNWVPDTANADYKEATCQAPGNDTFKCDRVGCQATKQEASAQKEHVFDEVTGVCQNPNCEEVDPDFSPASNSDPVPGA